MAQQADGTVYIDTLLDTTGFKAGGKDVEAAVRRMSKTVSGIGATAKIALQKQTDAFVKANQAYAQQEQKVEALKNKLKEMSEQKVATDEFKEIGKQIDNDTAKLNRLEKAQEEFITVGGKESSSAYRRREMQIEELRNSIRYAKGEQEDLLNTGGAYKAVDTSGVEQKLFNEEQRLQNMNNSLATSFASLKNKVDSYSGSAINLTNVKEGLGKSFSSLLSTAKKVAKTIGGTLLSALKRAGAAMLNLHKNTKKSDRSIGSSLKSMLKYGLGIRSIFVLVNRLRSALVDGFKNLAQYDSATNASISSLMSALTQLKNSFATAFSPILNVVAPILKTFINMVSRAVTYVGMLIAALTGQSSFVRATEVQEDYAASLGDTASGYKKAEKAQNKYLSGLDEIRRWENPNDNNSDNGGGGGYTAPTPGEMFETVPIESGLKGLADKIRDLVQSEDWAGLGSFIASGINEGLQKVYNAINWNKVGPKITYFVDAFTSTLNSLVDNLDWDLLGRTSGAGVDTIVNTLNRLIEGIDWVAIGNGFAAGVNGLAREVNFENVGRLIGNKFMILPNILLGFVQKLDWSLIGTQIGNALNGVVSSVDLSAIGQMLGVGLTGIFQAAIDFSRTFDWQALGTNIYQGINTFFASTDWATVGQGISNFVIGLLDALIVAVEGIDWAQFGESVKTAIANIDWTTIANKLFEVLDAAFGGLAAFLGGLLGDAVTAAKEYFQGKIEECGGNVVLRILKGIVDGLASIGQWIVDNIFTPIVNGFKKAFGISSPSTVMAELGKFLMGGLFNGISSLIEKVVSIFTGIKDKISAVWEALKTATSTAWNTIKTAVLNVWNSIKTAASTMWNGIKTTVTGVWNGLKNSASTIFSNIKSAISTAWENVKSTAIEKWNTIKEKVVGIANGIKETVSGAFSKLKEAVGTAFDGVVSRLKSPINSVIGFINGLIDKINGFIGKVNSALSFDVGFTNPFTGNRVGFSYSMNIPTINHIPYLAKGAVIPPNAPFMAVLGDQRQGNNIETPEALLRKIVREETDGQSINGNIELKVYLSGQQIYQEVMRIADIVRAKSGRSPYEVV